MDVFILNGLIFLIYQKQKMISRGSRFSFLDDASQKNWTLVIRVQVDLPSLNMEKNE